MSDAMMQTVLALAAVGIAVAYAGRRAWVSFRKARGGGAGSCGSDDCGCS